MDYAYSVDKTTELYNCRSYKNINKLFVMLSKTIIIIYINSSNSSYIGITEKAEIDNFY